MKKHLFLVLTAVVLTTSFVQAQPESAGKVKFHKRFVEHFNEPESPFFNSNLRKSGVENRYFPGIESPSEKGVKIMMFKIDPDDPAGAGRGPEIVSKDFTYFGSYSARIKVPDATKTQPDVGAVVGYFTYHMDNVAGLSEIDIEWLLADPEIIYVGTWTGKRGNLQRVGRVINLAKGIIYSTSYRIGNGENTTLTGIQNQPETIQPVENYNATSQFYTYGFDWYPDRITWWIIHPKTGKKIVLWDYSGSTPLFTGIPQNPTHYRLNFWHTNNWPVETRPNSIEKPLNHYELEIDWMSYKPFEKINKKYQQSELNPDRFPPKPNPEKYIVYRTSDSITVDGKLTKEEWDKAPWSASFVDIEGSKKPLPKYKTKVKALWDDEYIYFAAELEEPHVWAKLVQKDTVIYYDNDFEIFIDPNHHTHAYYELEVNAFGVPWDLLLLKPYRDGGMAIVGWDIAGLKVGIHVDGTLNDPSDIDKGWSVEIAIPLKNFLGWPAGGKLPEPGTQWRVGFSRVEWRTHIENGDYVKDINPNTGKPFPEDNWVWSPQGRINMHMPEMWGYFQFSGKKAGEGTDDFIPDPDFDMKWALRLVYYAQNEYFKANGRYTDNLKALRLTSTDFPPGLDQPVIMATRTTFECYYPNSPLTIYQDGKLADSRKTPKR